MEQNPQGKSVLMHIKELTEKEESLYENPDLSEDDIKECTVSDLS
ncbi:hypothetical protein [Mucilaginibacter sp. UYCu711]